MKTLKQLLSSIIILSLLLSTLLVSPISAGAAEYDESKLQFLLDLGIYSLTDDMEYYNEEINREDLASILSVFYGLTEESYSEPTNFDDVAEAWSSGHINTMVQHGIMSGYSDGLFRPLTPVTAEVAVKTLVSMMGYQRIAEEKGGYPNGYYATAAQIGLLDGITHVDRKANITRGDFTELLYNALEIPILKQTPILFVDEYVTDKNITLLSENLHIYKAKGMVTALPYVELGYGAGAGKDKIVVDNTEYLCQIDAYPYLGENVTIYYRQTDEDNLGTVLRISPARNSDSITVDAKDIVSFSNRRFTYMEDDRARYLDLPSSLLVIFNGKAMGYYQNGHLTPEQGEVRLCDIDEDGQYETAIVTYEVDYHIESIEEIDQVVYIVETSGAAGNRSTLKIDTTDKNTFYTVTDRNLAYELTKLQANDIISIAADNMDLKTGEIKNSSMVFRIKRASNRVKGALTQLNGEQLYIDGTAYDATASFLSRNKGMSLGETYTFHLNYLGKVADCTELGEEAAAKYALLLAVSTKRSLTTETQIKMYTQDGEIKIFDCAEKLYIDGKIPKGYGEDIEAYLKQSSTKFGQTTGMTLPSGGFWQLVKYSANEYGVITELDTIVNNAVIRDEDLKHSASHSSDQNLWVDGTFRNAKSRQRSTINQNTIFFIINPLLTSDTDYGILPYNRMENFYEEMHFFDADELGVSKVMFLMREGYGNSMDAYNTSDVMLYLSRKIGVDAKGDVRAMASVLNLSSGAQEVISLLEESLITAKNILPGDFIQIRKDSEGIVTEIKKGMSPINGGGEVTDAPNWAGTFKSHYDLKYGKVVAMNDTYIRLRFETDIGPIEETMKTSYIGTKIYIFDTTRNKLTQATLGDLRTEKKYGESDADMVGGFYTNGGLITLIIYR